MRPIRLTPHQAQERLRLLALHGNAEAAKRLGVSPQALWMWHTDFRRRVFERAPFGGFSPQQIVKLRRGARLILEALGEDP